MGSVIRQTFSRSLSQEELTNRKMGRSQQQKGRRGEIELAALLRKNGYDVQPGMAVSYGAEADLVGLDGIHCEVKRCEQLRLSEWMHQAVKDSEKFGDGLPVVFHRRNREEWSVTMRLSDWLKLYGGDFGG